MSFKFYYDAGIDGNMYYRPYKLMAIYNANPIGSLTVSQFLAGYKIIGNRYAYPSCLSQVSPIVLESNYVRKINLTINNPVYGSSFIANHTWTTGAIGGSSTHSSWGIGYLFSDGSKWSATTPTIPTGNSYTMP